jgi:hypothetical protein
VCRASSEIHRKGFHSAQTTTEQAHPSVKPSRHGSRAGFGFFEVFFVMLGMDRASPVLSVSATLSEFHPWLCEQCGECTITQKLLPLSVTATPTNCHH